MFGYLKKKMKDAVGSFSRKAQEDVKEEAVTDEEQLAEAKREEESLVKEDLRDIEDVELEEQREPESTGRGVADEATEAPRQDDTAATPHAEELDDQGTTSPGTPTTKEDPSTSERATRGATAPEATDAQATPEESAESGYAVVDDHPDVEEAPRRRSFFTRFKESFTKKRLSEEKFEELFWDLEVTLLESNVAVDVIEKIKEDLRQELTEGRVTRLGLEDLVMLRLKESIEEVLSIPTYNLAHAIQESGKRPYVIMFLGVNGGGKTTSLAKVANKLMNHDLSVVAAAADTFRAAAIDQLEDHAKKLGVKMISQGYNADPAAVAYDAVEHAKARSIDVVLIDTAGRLHSNKNLMAELQKVARVAQPDLKVFVGESITGNDCVEQAQQFDELIGVDAVILSKADVDEKGGAALSVSYVTKKPILYLGTGQSYGDLKTFDKNDIMAKLGF